MTHITSDLEIFVILVNGFRLLYNVITKSMLLFVVEALDLPLHFIINFISIIVVIIIVVVAIIINIINNIIFITFIITKIFEPELFIVLFFSLQFLHLS